MNKLMFAFAATMALATLGACKKKAGGDSGEAMAKMTEFKERMCKCTDTACAQKVNDDMTKWTQDSAKSSKGPVQMSEADQKKYTELGQQMGECSQKATGAGSGSDMAGSAAAGSGSAAAGSGSDAGSAAAGSGSAAAGSGSAAGSAAAGSAAAGSGSAAGSAAAGSAAAGSGAAKKDDKKADKK